MRGSRHGNVGSVDNMRAQHLVLDLDLVRGVEEVLAAVEQQRSHRLRVRMDQAGGLESLPASLGTWWACHSSHHSLWSRICTVLNTACAQNRTIVLRNPQHRSRLPLTSGCSVINR